MPHRSDQRRRPFERVDEKRRRIAVEAARLMTEHGLRDYARAKLKAAANLGIAEEVHLPKNSEVEAALREHQRLFQGDTQPAILSGLRDTAREALRFFARFEPRLVGAVLEGTADMHSAVCLHLHADEPQLVPGFLAEHGIPFEEQTRRLRYGPDDTLEAAVYLFSADSTPVDLTVLPVDRLRQAPLDRVDGKPMRRAALATLDAAFSAAD